MNYTFSPLSDDAVVVQFGDKIDLHTHKIIQTVANYLSTSPFEGMTEYVPAYTTLTVYYNPVAVYRSQRCMPEKRALPYRLVTEWLAAIMENVTDNSSSNPREIAIPVCYGGEYGPDLEIVAQKNQITAAEVVHYHAANKYLVYMMGFAPGFPYIGGMSDKIAASRKETPRLHIPAGSVGIAGEQTGVYPIDTPGGWQIIGQTPLPLLQPNQEPPTLLQSGDTIHFYAISEEDFKKWEN